MRIVSVCRRYGQPGGMENVVHDRAEALRALGHEVFVVSSPDGQYSDEFAALCVDQCERLAPEIVHLDSYDGARPWWRERPGNPRVVACTLHSNPWTTFFSKWNLWRRRRGVHPGISFTDTAEQCDLIGDTFDVVLAISQHECGVLRSACGVRQVRLVYNPIAPYFFDKPIVPVPDGAPMLHVGRNLARGADIALMACEQAGVPLRIVTDKPREAMVQVYDECAALVLPTFRADGFDLTVAEAWARSRPVIAGHTGSYASECPHTVPMGDVGALAAMLADARSLPPSEPDQFRPDFHAAAWLGAVA